MRAFRAVVIAAVAVLAAAFVNQGTASAGTAGYTPTQLTHNCQILKTETYVGNTVQYVHCADLFMMRKTATTAEGGAQGQDVCQTETGAPLSCGRIDTWIGRRRFPTPRRRMAQGR